MIAAFFVNVFYHDYQYLYWQERWYMYQAEGSTLLLKELLKVSNQVYQKIIK